MNVNLNNREKTILGVFLAIIIILVGIFAGIRPINKNIKANKQLLQDKQEERDQLQAKIDKIPGLQKQIKETYDKAIDLAEDFVDYNSIYRTDQLDMFLQNYADENEVKILKLELEPMEDSDLEYYYYEYADLAEDMRASADVNGTISARQDEILGEQKALEERDVEAAMGTKYGMVLKGTKENIWKYLKAIEDQSETILINKVDIEDFNFEADLDEEGYIRAEKPDGESKAEVIISLYSVYEMDEPDTSADD